MVPDDTFNKRSYHFEYLKNPFDCRVRHMVFLLVLASAIWVVVLRQHSCPQEDFSPVRQRNELQEESEKYCNVRGDLPVPH